MEKKGFSFVAIQFMKGRFFMSQDKTTKRIVQVALLIAVEVVLSRFLSINTPIVRISLGFIPIALTGMLYGPVWAGMAAVIGDIIGAVLVPTGAYFPGFTLTALATGVTYGLLLKKQAGWGRIIAASLIVTVTLNLCLDSLWLHILTGQGYLALLPTRIVKCVIMAPVQALVLRFITSRVYTLTTQH